MALTFWEKMHLGHLRDTLKATSLTAESIRKVLSDHNLPASCDLLASEGTAAHHADAKVAAEMAQLRAMARDRQGTARTTQMTLGIGIAAVVLIASTAPKEIRRVIYDYEHGQAWLLDILRFVFFSGLLCLAFYYLAKMLEGQVRLWKRLCSGMAEQLDGKAGLDGLTEIADWLGTNWQWFLPPKLGELDVIWAIGVRSQTPVLIVLEHGLSKFMTERFGARVTRRSPDIERWTRTNIFIGGARFRDAAHRTRVQSRLQQMYGGAVQCPRGVYLYGPFAFQGMFDDAGPHADVWIDLVDQVVNPNFHGSPSVTKKVIEELRLLKVLPGADVSHG